jgi:hypothetical protein
MDFIHHFLVIDGCIEIAIYEYCEDYGMEICLWTNWAAYQYTVSLNQNEFD